MKTILKKSSTPARKLISSFKESFHAKIKSLLVEASISDKDPYENHPWRLTIEKRKQAGVLSELLRGEQVQEGTSMGIDSEEIKDVVTDVNNQLEGVYNDFLEKMQFDEHIPKKDREELLNSKHTKSLLDNLRLLLARYFVLKSEGDLSSLPEIMQNTDIVPLLMKSLEKFSKIFEVDIPLYDILYDEFDKLKSEGERNPLEVFLGRDGVYAYLGRRAKDVAERRKMGPKLRKKLKAEGKVIGIYPEYLVYPRYFRDEVITDAKVRYLASQGITKESDPVFFDTGYVGTIPEQILHILGFSPEEIEKRIHLLSASKEHRRIRGVSENVRNEIIDFVEDSSKPEKTATGLFRDPKIDMIHHVAEPTSPEEQFMFGMIEQAITRHYWLKEKLSGDHE